MSSYFSIDAIMAEEERVPVEFMTHAYRLGHLDASSGTVDIEEGQQLDLPVWLAGTLAERQFILVELPRNLSSKVRESLLADPDSVHLRDKSPHFYETGLLLSRLCVSEEAARLPAAIQATLAARVARILSRSNNSLNSDVSDFVNSLTDLEQRLFWRGYYFVRDRLVWKKRCAGALGMEDDGMAGVAIGGNSLLGIGAASKAKRPRMAAAGAT